MRLSDNLFEIIPYAHLMTPEEQTEALFNVFVHGRTLSLKSNAILMEVFYDTEFEQCVSVLNPQNPLEMTINGVKAIHLVGLRGAIKLSMTLKVIRSLGIV